ncbi:transmembrane protease serine 2-like [Anopheles darlingi]|uniref:transmembrane protease serine 2-like n=1 Tax=Anopheles darlingi TaxID=43151 RepID=UPI0021002AC8|nr:transmembrane protease serine 2-like [Anopheles darlingi]
MLPSSVRLISVSILSPRWALTSYTCIIGKAEFLNNPSVDPKNLKLFAGKTEFFSSWNQLATPYIEPSLQIVNIKRVVPYPQNNQFMYTDDAVLLELATPLELNDVIGSVCLTETSSTLDLKQPCIIAGWASTLEDTATTEQYITRVTVANVPTERCNFYNGTHPTNMICVESLESDQNICYSDEGAPLMCYVNSTGQWQLEGFLSNYGNCDNRPAIYNYITPTISTWIRNTVGNGRMFEHTIINK